MDLERTMIIKKYRRSLREIIDKYKRYDDDTCSSIDIFDEISFSGTYNEEISFIKSEKSDVLLQSKFISFPDICTILCNENDFDDIFRMINKF